MKEKIKYKCKENDNRIRIYGDIDGNSEIDEIHIGSSLKKEGFIVIGLKDLKAALREAGYDIVKKPSFRI